MMRLRHLLARSPGNLARLAIVGAILGLGALGSAYAEGPSSVQTAFFHKSAKKIPGLEERSLRVDGEARSYLLYVPPSYDPSRPVALILVFHGGGGKAQGIARKSRMHELAAREGFIVAYPNGTGWRGNDGGGWNAKGDPVDAGGVNDLGFIDRLLDELMGGYAIDPRRIYATGLSAGGMFSYQLACNRSRRIAAIAPVAASLVSMRCDPAEGVAVMHVHGTRDENVPLEGGRGAHTGKGNDWPPVSRGLDLWARANQCSDERKQTFRGPETACWQYQGCGKNKPVQYCLVDGGGHGWPGAEPNKRQERQKIHISQTFDASARIWEFFLANPK